MGSGKGRQKRINANNNSANLAPQKIKKEVVLTLPNINLISEEDAAIKLRTILSEVESMNKNERLDSDRYLWEVGESLGKEYKVAGSGVYKTVFDGGDVVYKIAGGNGTNQPSDCIANLLMEATASQKDHDGLPVAKSKLVWHENGMPILIMEKVKTDLDKNKMPNWAIKIDGKQVGLNKNNEHVVYDVNLDELDISNSDKWMKNNPPMYPGNTYEFVARMRAKRKEVAQSRSSAIKLKKV